MDLPQKSKIALLSWCQILATGNPCGLICAHNKLSQPRAKQLSVLRKCQQESLPERGREWSALIVWEERAIWPLSPETRVLLKYLQVTGVDAPCSAPGLAQAGPSDPTRALLFPWPISQPVHTSQHFRHCPSRTRHKAWLVWKETSLATNCPPLRKAAMGKS